jgi:predicted ATPase/DNA-binding SARP family transcriptional activator
MHRFPLHLGVVAEARIEVRLLGPVQAAVGGRTLRLGGRRQLALLALLALEPGRAVPAGLLVEELWSGAPPPGAETTLRSYVSRLRHVLGRAAVVASGGGYALALEPDCLDAHAFEGLVHEGRAALARGAAGLASDRLRAALGLWRGRALADVCDGGALASEALRLDDLRLVALEERIDADLALARHTELVPELRALVREHPLRERLWRQLVLALYRAGRQADALGAYGEARALLDRELGLEPCAELKELERAILRQEVAPVVPVEVRHNLPAALASFVGRERELDDLEQLLRERRLVTVTGLGGIGKTRLALEAARRQVDAWVDGVWLVDLTELAEGGLLPGVVAVTLGVPEGAGEQPLEALCAHVRRLELLLVLDNCEHLVAACAELVHALLRGSPDVHVLATSRVPLAVRGEVDYALDPLAAPAEGVSPEEIERSPAVRLFVERAAGFRRDLPAAGGALATIGGICRDLEGLPLAIELAAARVKALSLDDIAARLDDRFRFLRAWQRVADPRHQTLETTMDWSYGLLAPEEQQQLRRLSVFAGGAALDAVADVCLEGDEDRAVELLGRLVDASLVQAEESEQMRYRLLETVRQYAAARLAGDPDADEVRRRHAEHYLRVAEAANLALDALGRGPQQHAPVLREQHNLRAALDWATTADVELAVRLMLALENFWVTHAVTEATRRFEQLARRADELDVVLRARLLRDRAACLDVLQDFTAAQPLYEQSRELFREIGDAVAVAHLDFRVGVVILHRNGDREHVRRLWEASLDTCRREGDRIGELQLVGNLGWLEFPSGDRERGRVMIEQSIAMAGEEGWLWWQAQWLVRLAAIVCADGRCEEAEPRAREALSLALGMGNRHYVRYALAVLARAAAVRGDRERALALWATVQAAEEPPGRFGRFDHDEYAAAMPEGSLPEPLSLDEAAALALSL